MVLEHAAIVEAAAVAVAVAAAAAAAVAAAGTANIALQVESRAGAKAAWAVDVPRAEAQTAYCCWHCWRDANEMGDGEWCSQVHISCSRHCYPGLHQH